MNGAIGQGAGEWWIAQVGVRWIDDAVLRSATNESTLLSWDGVIGRYKTEAEAQAALDREIAAAAE